VGTQFLIYRRPDASTTVSVLEGRIQILSGTSAPIGNSAASIEATAGDGKLEPISRPTQLSAGDEIHFAAGGRLTKRAAINVTEVATWREHRLWFEGASLPEVKNTAREIPQFEL
jgi:ferric-dicitrate binding protein FerR (iron transport regulator)